MVEKPWFLRERKPRPDTPSADLDDETLMAFYLGELIDLARGMGATETPTTKEAAIRLIRERAAAPPTAPSVPTAEAAPVPSEQGRPAEEPEWIPPAPLPAPAARRRRRAPTPEEPPTPPTVPPGRTPLRGVHNGVEYVEGMTGMAYDGDNQPAGGHGTLRRHSDEVLLRPGSYPFAVLLDSDTTGEDTIWERFDPDAPPPAPASPSTPAPLREVYNGKEYYEGMPGHGYDSPGPGKRRVHGRLAPMRPDKLLVSERGAALPFVVQRDGSNAKENFAYFDPDEATPTPPTSPTPAPTGQQPSTSWTRTIWDRTKASQWLGHPPHSDELQVEGVFRVFGYDGLDREVLSRELHALIPLLNTSGNVVWNPAYNLPAPGYHTADGRVHLVADEEDGLFLYVSVFNEPDITDIYGPVAIWSRDENQTDTADLVARMVQAALDSARRGASEPSTPPEPAPAPAPSPSPVPASPAGTIFMVIKDYPNWAFVTDDILVLRGVDEDGGWQMMRVSDGVPQHFSAPDKHEYLRPLPATGAGFLVIQNGPVQRLVAGDVLVYTHPGIGTMVFTATSDNSRRELTLDEVDEYLQPGAAGVPAPASMPPYPIPEGSPPFPMHTGNLVEGTHGGGLGYNEKVEGRTLHGTLVRHMEATAGDQQWDLSFSPRDSRNRTYMIRLDEPWRSYGVQWGYKNGQPAEDALVRSPTSEEAYAFVTDFLPDSAPESPLPPEEAPTPPPPGPASAPAPAPVLLAPYVIPPDSPPYPIRDGDLVEGTPGTGDTGGSVVHGWLSRFRVDGKWVIKSETNWPSRYLLASEFFSAHLTEPYAPTNEARYFFIDAFTPDPPPDVPPPEPAPVPAPASRPSPMPPTPSPAPTPSGSHARGTQRHGVGIATFETATGEFVRWVGEKYREAHQGRPTIAYEVKLLGIKFIAPQARSGPRGYPRRAQFNILFQHPTLHENRQAWVNRDEVRIRRIPVGINNFFMDIPVTKWQKLKTYSASPHTQGLLQGELIRDIKSDMGNIDREFWVL